MSKIHKALARALEEGNSPPPEEVVVRTSTLEHDLAALQIDDSVDDAIELAQLLDAKESDYLHEAKESEQVLYTKRSAHLQETKKSKKTSSPILKPGSLPTTVDAANCGLLVINDPSSVEAENFRMLRTRIFHQTNGKATRCILVTSAIPEEGKSFVSANLAAAIALGMEKHVLLIDADLRRPTQAGIFGLDNSRGLVNHLRDGDDLGQLIQKTQLDKLSVITSGESPLNPSEIVDSRNMSAMISEALNRYPDRVIIIDSPPIQSAAETTVLSKFVDGVVLVVRWGQAKKEQVRKAAELIGSDKILGIVFNQCPPKSIKDHYHAYYGHKP